MTYDPDRDARAPSDVSPHERPYSRQGAGLSVALMLGLLAAFVAVGIWYYASPDDPADATDNRPAQERLTTGERSTTGSGTLPRTPTPPVAPAQPDQ
jgi:hypothetical protein